MTIRSIKLKDERYGEQWFEYACENDNPRRSGYLWEITL